MSKESSVPPASRAGQRHAPATQPGGAQPIVPKLCKHCAYVRRDWSWFWFFLFPPTIAFAWPIWRKTLEFARCASPGSIAENVEALTGYERAGRYCSTERQLYGNCGVEARHFIPRRGA